MWTTIAYDHVITTNLNRMAVVRDLFSDNGMDARRAATRFDTERTACICMIVCRVDDIQSTD